MPARNNKPHKYRDVQPPLQIIVIALVSLSATVAVAQINDPAVESMAGLIESNQNKLDGNTIVVFPFPYSDGVKSVEGGLFSERLITRLSEGGVVRVVERALLDKIMAEQKLSAVGFVDPQSGVQIGKLIGARGIVSGSITDLGENIEIHLRLVNVETSAIVATSKVTTRKTIKTFISPLWSEIDRIKEKGPGFNLKFWVDKGQAPAEIPAYRIGDFVTFHIETDRDCYVTVFDFTTSGSVHVLFPNTFRRDNHIKAGRTYTFPDPQDGFKIRVTAPPGIERLKVFATSKHIPLFKEDFSVEKFRSVTESNYNVTRDLETVFDSLEDTAWAETNLEICIEQILRGMYDRK